MAAFWSVAHLRDIATGLRYEPSRIVAALRKGLSPQALSARLGSDESSLDAALIRGVVEARTALEARQAANEALIDLSAAIPSQTSVRTSCLRIALLGAVLGVALLVAGRGEMRTALMDVVAMGAAGALVAQLAGRAAERLGEAKRKDVDRLVERLMLARWNVTGDVDAAAGTWRARRNSGTS